MTAAGQAFLANRVSNANLSNAAAAAALRSHTTSPTPVAEVQTKRMIQRRGSASSNGSARSGLQRRDSGGSMTERSFRDPSPSRNTSSDYRFNDAPPVPALPKSYMSPPPLPSKSNRRAASVERPPERVLSPPPSTNARGVSLDRGPGMMPSQLKARTQARSIEPGSVGQADRAQIRESVNFSRPMSPVVSPPASPPNDRRLASSSPKVPNQPSSANAPNVGRLRDGEIESIQYNLNRTAQAPVKKKKKSVAKNTEGSYLASGVSGGKATGTMVQSTPPRQQNSTQSTPSPVASSSHSINAEEIPRPLPKKKKKKVARTPGSQDGDLAYGSHLSDSDSAVSDRSNVTDRSRTYNTRAAGLLAKQPSIVREDREAEEQEDVRSPITDLVNPIQNGSAVRDEQPKLSTSSKRTTPIHHTKKSSLDIPNTELVPISQSDTSSNPPLRQQSLSPARAAHFSAQPILETPENLKHQPPARSISPVKSALKHSPSRGPSPVAGLSIGGSNRRGPASEASDTTSMISDEGSKSMPRKKKHARVSFDSESVVVGRAATPPTDPDSPMIMSPQNKEASTRRWLGLSRDQYQITPNNNRGDDTAIKPTPVLPSFGSVRERHERGPTVESAQNITEPTGSALKSGTTPDQRGESIHSAVLGSEEAGMVTQELNLNASNDPLPPEVTSVEGTGYQSDTDNSVTSDHAQDSQLAEAGLASAVAQHDPHTDRISNTGVAPAGMSLSPQSINNEVPSIAVQPATPALGNTPSIAIQPATPGQEEYRKGGDQYWFDMPGGFPTLADDSVDDRPAVSTTADNRSPDISPATAGISEPVPEAVAPLPNPGASVTSDVVEGLHIQVEPDVSEDSDHTNNSVYSDAAEDFEGDGFGSINAIVDSPTSPPVRVVPMKQSESPTESKTKSTSLRSIPLNRNESELSEPGSEAGWDKAQAYWSGLSESRKQQIERAAAQGGILDASEKPEPKPKKKKSVPKNPSQEVHQFDADREDEGGLARPSSNTRGSKAKSKAPVMKSSMRDNASESHPETHMRSSMRGSVPVKPSVRASLPPEPTAALRGALQKKNRPISAMSSESYRPQASEVASRHDRSASLGNSPNLAAKAKPKSPLPLRRTVSSGSDSSSSFKKARPKSSDTGRYTMKRSMRGSSVDEGSVPGHSRASSMTTRASLPADTARRPFSSVGPSMRSSMRDSIDSSKTTRTKSPSRFSGFGKSSKPKAAPKGPTSRFSSRFADSSDEDDGPIKRRSRFADSSDEDEPATGLTPVRGIPRRIDEGDSTDLEDSSGDEKPTTKAIKSPVQQQSTRFEGTALGAGSLRTIPEGSGSPTTLMGTDLKSQRAAEKAKKKRSFFGGLGSKKIPKSEPFTLPTEVREPQQDTISAKPGRPLSQTPPDVPGSPQSPKEQRLLGPGSPGTVNTEASTAPGKLPKSPKLQRRISAQQAEKIQMKRGISDSWPLPQSPGGTSTPTMRPTTSDGTPKGKNGTIGLSGLNKELRLDRPGLGDRQNTVETTATGGTGTVKKKKGWFKKAFGR